MGKNLRKCMYIFSHVALVVKNLPINAGDMGLISGLGRSPKGMVTQASILTWRIP